MGKGANKQLLGNSGTAQQRSGTYDTAAQSLYGPLTTQLQAEAKNPAGYTPQQLAAMSTASQQSLGGSVGGVLGQSELEAARTNNAGGFQGAEGGAVRSAQRQLSQNALGVQEKQADLQQAQQQQALSALQQLYGTNIGAGENYLSESNTALNAENQSHPIQQGFKTFADVLTALSGAAKNGAAIAAG